MRGLRVQRVIVAAVALCVCEGVAMQRAAGGDSTVDCIRLVDLKKHVVSGKWECDGKQLTSGPGDPSRLVFPVIPTGSYNIKFAIERADGGGPICAYVPVGKQCAVLYMMPDKIGIDKIDGKRWDGNDTSAKINLNNHASHAVEVAVVTTGEKASLSVSIDGKNLIKWTGAQASLAFNPDWAIPEPYGIGVGTWASKAVIRSYQFNGIFKKLPSKDAEGKSGPISISVDVPCEAPKGPAPGPGSAGADAIERPEYQNYPKALVKNLVTVNGLYVMGGTHKGGVLEIIATVSPQSRRGNAAGAGFFREDGDEMMKTAFEEAIRAVTLRYPLWGPGRLDFSFDEKSPIHGGPSAGTAFAVATLSALEGFEIDAKCAITGDITADWKVRPVGGVPYKILGAEEAKLKYMGIPATNEESFADMGIMIGAHAYWDAQVLSLSTLQEALAFARTDRPEKLAEAMRLFAEVQEKLEGAEKKTLADPETVATLKKIVQLAPNHLSAKYTLAVATKTAPRTLSEHATVYCIVVALDPWQRIFTDSVPEDQIVGVTVDPAQLMASRKLLDILRKYAHKKYAGDVVDIAAFIETAGSVSAKSGSLSAFLARRRVVFNRFEGLLGDEETFEEAWASGY